MTTPSKYALLFIEGERAGKAFSLGEGEVTIGRSRQNGLTLSDDQLSRKHVAFRTLGEDLMLEDLDSAHGTFLNDKRLRGILSVQPGDMVTIGSQKFKVVLEEEVASLIDDGIQEIDQAAAASVEVAEEDDAHTRFGAEEEQDETRYHQAADFAYDEEDDDAKTRVLADQATRMLDVEELQGLKPGKESDSKKTLAIGIALLVLLLGGGGFATLKYFGGPAQDADAMTVYSDSQHEFKLTYPAIWEKTGADPDAAITFEWFVDGQSEANCKVFAEQSLKHEVTGLSLGFKEYTEILKDRHPGFRLKGSQTLDMNGIRMIQFGYAAEDSTGFGIFTFNGGTRFVVETSTAPESYYKYKEPLLAILGTFKLGGEQMFIDFPLADQEVRHKALSNPEELEKEAWQNVRLARDLMKRRQVRLDNLFRSVENYGFALQKASSLSSRPDFYDEVAMELVQATTLLNGEIKEQQYKVTMAKKIGDIDGVQFELSKLMRMVPDKNDPVYRDSAYQLKKYGGS